jgi:type III restriction enzyme
MSVPSPKGYQSEAIEFLSGAIGSLVKLDPTNSRLIVFKSPTGSGKTLVVAFALDMAHEEYGNRGFVTLWLSPGKGDLHKQSARSLASMLESSSMQVKLLDSRDDIVANENPSSGTIFVVNWEKLRSQDSDGFSNKMLKPGERTSFFGLLENISSAGLDLVVVIDESHTNLDGPQTVKLMNAIQEISPFIQLEASATPTTAIDDDLQAEGFHFKHTIPFRRVEEEGMVRRSVLLNTNFADLQARYPNENLERQALFAAWERTLDLEARYKEAGSLVKPLLLIQYPDGAGAEGRARVVEEFLNSVGLVKDSTYATWLSGDHSDDLENISKYESPYRALIFKQAIATGWDCPRAQVLVQFREPGSTTFRIQTLGRILRTPEQKHYEDETLNVAYVYSDLAGVSVNVTTDLDDYPLQDIPVRRGPQYPETGLKLTSAFQPRRREFHYPSSESLQKALFDQLDSVLESNLPEKPINRVPASILVDAKVLFRDLAAGLERNFEGSTLDGFLGDELIETLYNKYLVQKIGNYRSRIQTRSRIKNVIVRWFGLKRPLWFPDEIQRFVVAHSELICEAINAACLRAQVSDEVSAVADARSKRRTDSNWEIRLEDLVSSKTYEKVTESGCLTFPPMAAIGRSMPEKRFETWAGKARKSGHILWWWKNGERDEKYLGVPYKSLSNPKEPEEFSYPDYLIMTSTGELLVFEIKDVNDRDGKINQKSHSIAVGLSDWGKALNKERVDNAGISLLPKIVTGVVVPIEDVNNGVILKIGNTTNWCEPSANNLSLNVGWSDFQF